MNFERIARNASERGDHVRAVIVLAQGLKRQHEVEGPAFELLVNTYANYCGAPGVEREVALVVARHFDAGFVSGQIVARLQERDRDAMVRAFRAEVEGHGVWVEPVELYPAAEPPLYEANTLPEIDSAARTHEPTPDEPTPDEPTPDELPEPLPPAEELEPGERLPGQGWRELPLEPDPPPAEREQVPVDELATLEQLRPAPHEPAQELETQPELDEPGPRPPQPEPSEPEPPAPDPRSPEDRDPAPEVATARPERPASSEATPALEKSSPRDSERKPQPARALSSGRRRRRGGALVIGALVLMLGVGGWISMRQGGAGSRADHQLEMFDPLNPGAFEAALERGPDEDEQRSGRARFVEMLLALERGEVVEVVEPADPSGLGPWARGALALAATQRRDFERGLFHVEAMERRHPTSLATLWVRARLEEERGAFGKAREAYARALGAYPKFVPGMLGRLRVAFRTGDRGELERAAAALRQVNPMHSYLRLADAGALAVEGEYLALSAVGSLRGGGANARAIARDQFLRAYQRYHAARLAWRRGDLHTARQAARDALTIDPHLSPALLLQGALQGALLDVQEAGRSFARLARIEELSVAMRLALMIVAPRVLTEAGRPDLAFVFTIDPAQVDAHRERVEAARGGGRRTL